MSEDRSFQNTLKVAADFLKNLAENKNVMTRLSNYLYKTSINTAIKNIESAPQNIRSYVTPQKPYNPYSRGNYR